MPPYTSRTTQQGRTPGIGAVDFKDKKSIVDFVEERYEKRDGHRFAMERQWFLNIAQYLGRQYDVYDNLTRTLVQDKSPPWRVRLISNRLMMQVRKAVSKFLRQRPEWTVIPATTDQDDQVKALVGTRVLKAYWRAMDMDWKTVEAAFWLFTTGNVFFRTVWDPSAGDPIDLTDFAYLAENPEERSLFSMGMKTGDLRVDVVSPFELDPDPTALALDRASHVLHTKRVSLDELTSRYGKAATKNLAPDSTGDESLTTFFLRKLKSMVGPFSPSKGGTADECDDGVVTHTLWVNPTEKYPDGYFCVVAGGEVLHARPELPNPFHRVPFVHLVETPVPGRFWATSMLEQCIGLQGDYNRARSQICESRNLFSKPKILNPKGSGLAGTSFDSEPGERIDYTYPLKPEPWTPPPLPEYVMRSIEYTLKDMEDISGVHEVTQARAPSGVRSGVAIAQLQEQDDQLLGPTFMLAEKALAKLGGMNLELLAANVTESRILKIVGHESEVDAFEFIGADLVGQNKGRPGVTYFDVEVHMGSQLPQSPNMRRQMVIDLTDRRILDPVADRKKIFQLLELGTEEPILNDSQLDRQNARRENLQLRQGILIEINDWDDDETHLETHRRDQKQPDYTKSTTPLARQAANLHCQMHEARLAARTLPTAPGGPPDLTPPAGPPLPPPEGATAA